MAAAIHPISCTIRGTTGSIGMSSWRRRRASVLVRSIELHPRHPRESGDPAILMQGGWVYMMANRYRGTIYTGVTADIAMRVWQHRQGIGSKFVAE
ncbi:GIY-YIG nuclease family protein [Sphingomonas psychrolutea]|uniref:GIY-YIG nuclease family protein n=1 Tax=Sphingomonas psychrolutea TaxID=1259676 RepID=UPI0035A23D50